MLKTRWRELGWLIPSTADCDLHAALAGDSFLRRAASDNARHDHGARILAMAAAPGNVRDPFRKSRRTGFAERGGMEHSAASPRVARRLAPCGSTSAVAGSIRV